MYILFFLHFPVNMISLTLLLDQRLVVASLPQDREMELEEEVEPQAEAQVKPQAVFDPINSVEMEQAEAQAAE